MRIGKTLLVAASCVGVAALATWWWPGRAASVAVVAAPVPAASAAIAPPGNGAVAAQARPRAAASAIGVAAAPAATGTDLAANVDRWSASADPGDAMRAYRAVLDCLVARRDDRRPAEEVAIERKNMENAVPLEQRERLRRNWQTSSVRCGNLRSDQVQSRTQWLARAAQAGVPLAAVEFIFEGPDGEGFLLDAGVPRPPLTDAWRAQRDTYVQAALDRCDMALVGTLGMAAARDTKDLANALSFWQSHTRCQGSPEPTPLRDDPLATRYLHDLGGTGLQLPDAAPE